MTEVKNINIQSKFKSLDLISFENRKATHETIDPQKITYEISINYNIDQHKKTLTFNCPIKIFAEPAKQLLLGSIETRAEFEVENLYAISDKEKGVPTSVMATFVGLLISSTRGMLNILSKGTSFEQGILPIINPMIFFQQSLQPEAKV